MAYVNEKTDLGKTASVGIVYYVVIFRVIEVEQVQRTTDRTEANRMLLVVWTAGLPKSP